MAEIGQHTEPPTNSNFVTPCYFAVEMSIGHRQSLALPTHALCSVILSPTSTFCFGSPSFAGPTPADLARRHWRIAECFLLLSVIILECN